MNDHSLSLKIKTADHETNTSSADLTCEWAHDVRKLVLDAEKAETYLSYSSECKSEGMRKLVGAYYTPADVAKHFWAIFFERKKITTPQDAQRLLDDCLFIEPSVGAGALFFSLLENFIAQGLSPERLSNIKADLIDINDRALEFVDRQIGKLECVWHVKFNGIRLINKDFRRYDLRKNSGVPVFFGNPPFVANEKGSSKWKNLYADFVELSLTLPVGSTHIHYILPLSITFSRDYCELRKQLRESRLEISVSSYDNIPDTLFKSGKPKHTNTNKANSQRCSILTAIPSNISKISSSKLYRWSRTDRAKLLSEVPAYEDVSQYHLDDQILRPASSVVADYLQTSLEAKRLASFTCSSEEHQLFVASVARNYIGFREARDSGCNTLGFTSEEDFLTVLGVLSSDLFFEYWLSVGDGFHLTRSNILNFPIAKDIEEKVRMRHHEIREYWENRAHFEKVKLNKGKKTRSFDFSKVVPALLHKDSGHMTMR